MESLLVFFFFCLGAIVASFIGVVVSRMHTGLSFVYGHSRCDACAVPLREIELVPIISFFVLRGRCRVCRSRISYHSTLIEIALGMLFVLAYLRLGLSLELPVFLVALSFLLAVVLYDVRHMVVPRSLFLPFTAFAALFALFTAANIHELGGVFLVAGLIGLAFFLLFYLSGGRAMGLGDAPMALGLALLVGSVALSGLIFSFWVGAVIGIGVLVCIPEKRRMGVEVPFVPFLAAGFLLAYFTLWNPFVIIQTLLF